MSWSEESSGELPEGWASPELRTVVQPSKRKVEPRNCRKAHYLSLEHIEPETGHVLGRGRGSDVRSAKAIFSRGDVLYGKLRPYLNKVTVPDFDGVCSTDILVFEKRESIDSRLLRYFLSQRHVVEFANHHSSGVQLPRISFSTLGGLPIPLPPLAEQRRIVAKVEELLAQVNSARQHLARVRTILKRFRQAVLAAACDGRLTADWQSNALDSGTATQLVEQIASRRAHAKNTANARKMPSLPSLRTDLELPDLPESWCWVDLRFLAAPDESLCYGVVQPGENGTEGNFLVRAGDLDRGTVVTEQLRRIPNEVDDRHSRSRLLGGELLVTVVGAGIGNVALTPQACRGFNIARAVAKIPIREVTAEYVFRWLQAPTAFAWMWNDAREVARPTLNIEQLETLPVPLPPLSEQREIVRRVEALFKLADNIEAKVAAATARADKLTQAILAKAFRGELVPTEAELARAEGREYEPASVLLARIRAEREADPIYRRRPKAVAEAARQQHIERGQCVLDILLLLEAWEKPVSVLALEPALVLMQNDAARRTLLEGIATKRRRQALQKPPAFITGLDAIYSALERNGTVRRVGQNALQLVNEGTLSQATKQDRAKAGEVIRAIEQLADIRNLQAAVAAVTNERYEVAIR